MSGTSLDGVDAVIADFAPAAGGVRHPRRRARRLARRCCATSCCALQTPGANELSRARRARPTRWPTLYADAIAQRARCGEAATRATSRGRRARPDAAPSSRARLDAAAQQSRARRRAHRHHRRRRLPQPRRRGGRAGRAAGAGVPRGAVRRSRRAIASIVNIGGIANITDLPPNGRPCAASTPVPATCCSICGARAIAAIRSMRQGAWAATGAVDATLLGALLAEPYFAAHAAEEHASRHVQSRVARAQSRKRRLERRGRGRAGDARRADGAHDRRRDSRASSRRAGGARRAAAARATWR